MTPQDQQQQQQNNVVAVPTRETVREDYKIHLILSYLGNLLGLPLGLIPLLSVKDDEFIRWHGKQSLVILGAGFVIGVISVPLAVVGIGFCTAIIAAIAVPILSIVALIKSLNGERWRIPLIADLADKF